MLESRAMLCILAMTTLMATIWTGTDGDRADALELYLEGLKAEKKKKIFASLINYERVFPLKFRKAASSNKNVVDLLLQEKPTPSRGQPHIICENDLGIEYQYNDVHHVFCNLHTISLEIYNDDVGKEQMRFIVHFKSQSTDPLKLYVPVFETPERFSSTSKRNDFHKWAMKKFIEFISPVHNAELSSLASNKIVTFDFGWLDRLGMYGLYRWHISDSNEFSAWTRPFVLDSSYTDAFKNLWETFKGT